MFGEDYYGMLRLGPPTGCGTGRAVVGGSRDPRHRVRGWRARGGHTPLSQRGPRHGGRWLGACSRSDRQRPCVALGPQPSELGPVPRSPGESTFRSTPARGATVCGGSPVVMVACGNEHTLALTRAGHVWNCGYRQMGQTGHECAGEMRVPTQVHAGGGEAFSHDGGRGRQTAVVVGRRQRVPA